MSLRSYIVPRIASKILSEKRLMARRKKFERDRIRANKNHCVEFFHDPSDPYSQLLQHVLPKFSHRYNVHIITHIVGPPCDDAAPEREKLKAYSHLDVIRLAKKACLDFTLQSLPPALNTTDADNRLKDAGHYMGGTLYYGGEWYWGLDRLHYLEARLEDLGLRLDNTSCDYIYNPPTLITGSGQTGVDLHWYLSFRSPYTAIVKDRVKTLADAYGANLKLRFVLPMVMRNLPVSPAKKAYIPLDTAREARRLNVNFGRVLDPVGRAVEMGYALLPWANTQGLGFEYVQSWLSGVWAEGIDAGSHKGLCQIVERAGLDWNTAKDFLEHNTWRHIAETNRIEMMSHGVWGVPSFRVKNTVTWGQDRLWVIEDALQRLSEHLE